MVLCLATHIYVALETWLRAQSLLGVNSQKETGMPKDDWIDAQLASLLSWDMFRRPP